MKILFLSFAYFPNIGGIEVNSELLATKFSEAGHEVILVTSVLSNESYNDLKCNFTIIRNPGVFNLLKLHIWADVVFQNNPSLRLGWLGFIFSSKSVIAVRTWIRRDDNSIVLQDRLKRLMLKFVKKRIYISQAIADDCKYPGVVIGNPYNSSIFKISKPYPERKRKIIFVGRIVESKGLDTLFTAIKSIDGYFSDDDVSIVGDGPLLEDYKELTRKLGLTHIIKFLGQKKPVELADIYNEHLIHVTPSLWAEPFGNVALEGIACGCIAIGTRSGGLKDAIGECGLLFKNSDSLELEERIISVLKEQSPENKFFIHRQKHLNNHLLDNVANKYLDVIL